MAGIEVDLGLIDLVRKFASPPEYVNLDPAWQSLILHQNAQAKPGDLGRGGGARSQSPCCKVS